MKPYASQIGANLIGIGKRELTIGAATQDYREIQSLRVEGEQAAVSL